MADSESADIAHDLFLQTVDAQGIMPGQLIVHADRVAAMTAKTVVLSLPTWALLTPGVVQYGPSETVLEARRRTLQMAYQLHPERFVRKVATADQPP